MPAAFAGRLQRRSAAASSLTRTALAFALMLLTAHQAAAQAAAAAPAAAPTPTPAVDGATPAAVPAAASTPAAATTPTPAPAATTPTSTPAPTATPTTPTPTPAPAAGAKAVDAAAWRSLSNSLAQTMADTLARPVNNRTTGPIGSMAQSAADFIRNVGTGKNIPDGVLGGRIMGQQAGGGGGAAGGGGLGGGAVLRRVTDGELMSAFNELRDTAQGLGLVLPASSRAPLSTWSGLADALQGMRGGGAGADVASRALPALAGAMRLGGAANLAQATSPWNWPGMAGAALLQLENLGIDAFLNGPGAVLALTSLGLGLAASILGIVGGSLFIAGASVLLGAGVDSMNTANNKKHGGNHTTFNMDQFNNLARESQQTVLTQALSPESFQFVDLVIGAVDAIQAVTGAAA
ncbi:hypothetical protein HXX76_011848 [Chlamydomonas incerta]|uniref:Uncharacterized protein n=1 Tax=Chlamydomonas incerta TaxID=51695 RepID=A0A835SJA3_CHLIN|nr:hypothetical protein HXX76_011848 [Chlamydomonas incerta]|eukprot:KAG2428168.1 hypothetical protein HXX76_011848 [Chlamydomonas incerta]